MTTLPTWRSTCPLRMWRTKREMSQGDVALFLRVSRQSVANWEQGVCDPDQHWNEIARLIRRSERRLRDQWKAWRSECPR